MTAQELLRIIAFSLLGLGGLLVALAGIFFVRWNVRDIRADITGKKRASAVAQIQADQAKGVRDKRASSPAEGADASGAPTPARASASGRSKGRAVPEPKQGASSASARPEGPAQASTTVIAEAATETTVLPESPEPPAAGEGTGGGAAREPAGVPAGSDVPATFRIASKIVLTASTEFVSVEQGDNHA